jgi:hypothetical protein
MLLLIKLGRGCCDFHGHKTRPKNTSPLRRQGPKFYLLKKSRCLAQGKAELDNAGKAQVVLELKLQFPLDGLLEVAGLARSTFYYQVKALQAPEKHGELKQHIQAICARHKGRYGYRRVTAVLRQMGQVVNNKVVLRLTGELGLKSLVRKKRYRAYKGETGRIAPNVLERKFKAKEANQKWVTDVTEFKVAGEKLYLSPVMDCLVKYIRYYNYERISVLGGPNTQVYNLRPTKLFTFARRES